MRLQSPGRERRGGRHRFLVGVVILFNCRRLQLGRRGRLEGIVLRVALGERLEAEVLLLPIDRIAAWHRRQVEPLAGFVRRLRVFQLVLGLCHGLGIHAQKIVEVELGAIDFALDIDQAKALVERELDAFEQRLQTLRVILLIERFDIVV